MKITKCDFCGGECTDYDNLGYKLDCINDYLIGGQLRELFDEKDICQECLEKLRSTAIKHKIQTHQTFNKLVEELSLDTIVDIFVNDEKSYHGKLGHMTFEDMCFFECFELLNYNFHTDFTGEHCVVILKKEEKEDGRKDS